MSVSASFRRFALDQLAPVATSLRARSMFGGVGIYSESRFFALLDDDTLYLKADARSAADFVAAGMPPFRPFGDAAAPMQYYAVPVEFLEDATALRPWVAKALAAAERRQLGAHRAAQPRGTAKRRVTPRPKRR